MPLLQLVVILIVIGVLLWAVNSFIPMDARIKQIINAVVIIAVVIWLLFFLLHAVGLNPEGMKVGMADAQGLRLACGMTRMLT